jgi:CubicO group peptidase (beta-lactamase class C family)
VLCYFNHGCGEKIQVNDSIYLQDLQGYVEKYIMEKNIPAMSVAIWHNNILRQAASGILDQKKQTRAEINSVFQIGSITKVMTASLVMKLVDDGLVDIDCPVKYYLPDFLIADKYAAETITVRQLISHTSGIAGDYFPNDSGHKGNLIARYVDRCSLLPLVHKSGQMYSYSNSAFAIAGRLIEVVGGLSWYEAVREHIYQPLGMSCALADFRESSIECAKGHVYHGENTNRWVQSERGCLSQGLAPAGLTPAMSAENLIRFARAHMNGGLNQQGQRWLSIDSIQEMQTPQIALPKISEICDNYSGLGWGINDYYRYRVISHGGATNGFLAMLQMIPELNTAFVILINGFRPPAMKVATNTILQAITGIDMQEPEPTNAISVGDFRAVEGCYESLDASVTISIEGQRIVGKIIHKIDPLPPTTIELRHIAGGRFAVFSADGKRRPNMVFIKQGDQQIYSYLFNSKRLNKRS